VNDNVNTNGTCESLPEATALSQERWRELCLELLTERQQLRSEIAELRTQRQQLLDALFPEDAKEVTLSKEELFAQRITEPSIHELIDNLEKSLGGGKR
jgi:hypothetical protein